MVNRRTTEILFCLILISGLLATGSALADVSITDSEGNQITLAAPASRIMATNTDCAEMLVALGAADRIAGVSRYVVNDTVLMSHLPEGAENIGDWQIPDIEKITEMNPDLIISYSSSKPKNLDQITALGIPIAYLDCYMSDTLADDARALGTLTGTEEKAESFAAWYSKWNNAVSERMEPVNDSPTVYMEGYSDFSAQGKGSGGDGVLALVRGTNLAAALNEQWPKVSAEWVISENPDYILKLLSSTNAKTLEELVADISAREGFSTISAVKNGKVYALNGELLLSPKYPVGLVTMAKILHPDACSDLDPAEALEEYDREFVSGFTGMETVYPGI